MYGESICSAKVFQPCQHLHLSASKQRMEVIMILTILINYIIFVRVKKGSRDSNGISGALI